MEINQMYKEFVNLLKKHSEVCSYLLIIVGFYCLLHSRFPSLIQTFLFAVILLIFFVTILKYVVKELPREKIAFFALVQVGVLFCLKIYLQRIEFWGDEVGVINIALNSFENISDLTRMHAAVPPFDYWMLHMWLKVLNVFTYPPTISEFLYRIPYFFFHCLATFFFLVLVKHFYVKEKNEHVKLYTPFVRLLFLSCFLLYFFNPLLLQYSFEVRFYSFAVLGIGVTLYLFVTNKLFTPIGFFVSSIFCLNSVYQFIAVFPLLAVELLRKRDYQALVQCFIYLALFFSVQSRLNYYEPVSSQESLQLILHAAQSFIQNTFISYTQLAVFLSVLVFLSWKKEKKPLSVFLLASYIAIFISLASYIKGYFDFFQRHYLVTMPLLLLALTYPLLTLRRYLSGIFMGVLLLIFFIPWVTRDVDIFLYKHLATKGNLHAKEIAQAADQKNLYVVFLQPKKGSSETVDRFSFLTFHWYLNQYKVLSFEDSDITQYCGESIVKTAKLFVTFISSETCLDTDPTLRKVTDDYSQTKYYIPVEN